MHTRTGDPSWPNYLLYTVKGTVSRVFLLQVFSMNHFAPKPLNILPVSLISVVHLDLRISPRIFEKFETALTVYTQGLGGN